MVLLEIYHLSTSVSWAIVPNKSGYSLVTAYNIRDDDQLRVDGIQRRTSGGYTILFNGVPNGELDLWLTWVKIGTNV